MGPEASHVQGSGLKAGWSGLGNWSWDRSECNWFGTVADLRATGSFCLDGCGFRLHSGLGWCHWAALSQQRGHCLQGLPQMATMLEAIAVRSPPKGGWDRSSSLDHLEWLGTGVHSGAHSELGEATTHCGSGNQNFMGPMLLSELMQPGPPVWG
jgi:hypothetical protein